MIGSGWLEETQMEKLLGKWIHELKKNRKWSQVACKMQQCKDHSWTQATTIWRQLNVAASILRWTLKRVPHTRLEPVKTEPMSKHMLELEQKTGKINSRPVSALSPNILFFFVKLMWSTQFSYHVSLFLTTTKICSK